LIQVLCCAERFVQRDHSNSFGTINWIASLSLAMTGVVYAQAFLTSLRGGSQSRRGNPDFSGIINWITSLLLAMTGERTAP
jgi:hypothetical protein